MTAPPPPLPSHSLHCSPYNKPEVQWTDSGGRAGGRGEKSPQMLLQIASPRRGTGSCLRVLLFLFSILSLMSVSALSPPASWMSMGLSCSRLGGKAGNYLPPIDVSYKWSLLEEKQQVTCSKTIAIFLGFYCMIKLFTHTLFKSLYTFVCVCVCTDVPLVL